MINLSCLNMGQVGSKLCQFKNINSSLCRSFTRVFLKLCQNVCFYNVDLNVGHVGPKSGSLYPENLINSLDAIFASECFDFRIPVSNMIYVWSKSRSLGQVVSRGFSFAS